MINQTLLSTKFTIPPGRRDIIFRPGLVQKLNEGLVSGCRLILLSAPTGYGKTTLLIEWIKQLEEKQDDSTQVKEVKSDDFPEPVHVAWLSMDIDDSDAIRFLTYLVSVFNRINENIGVVAETLLQTSVAAGFSYKAVIKSLINDLAEYPDRMIIILDDYYLAQSQEINEIMVYLLDHLPECVHLVISTRSDPPLPLARFRVRHQLEEIRQADLRFDLDEVSLYFNHIRQFWLDEQEIRTLEQRTEGWAAGLHLVALSLEGRNDRAGFIQAFNGSNRYVLEYLIEEVLSRQDIKTQNFLMVTSIPEKISAELCDALTGRNDSRMMLDLFEKENLFLIPLDHDRTWYRYHNLFVEFLRGRLQYAAGMQSDLEEYGSFDVRRYHQRAGVWFEENGFIEEAIKHAIQSEDYERVAVLIESHAYETILTEESHFIFHWMAKLPDELIYARPGLCLNYAWYLFISGQHEAVEKLLNYVSSSSSSQSQDINDGIAALKTVLAVLGGDVKGTIEIAKKALGNMPEGSSRMRSMVLANLGMAYDLQGDVNAATRIYQEAFQLSQESNTVVVNLLAAVQLADLKVLQGQLIEAEKMYLDALTIGTKNGKRLPITSMVLAGLGRLYYEWNDLEKSEKYLQECIDLADLWESADMRASGSIYMALLKMAQGNQQKALAFMEEARSAIHDDLVSLSTVNITRAYSTRLSIIFRDFEKILEWQNNFPQFSREIAINQQQIESTTLARIHLLRNEPEKVISELEQCVKLAEAEGMIHNQIENLILQALAFEAQGRSSQAVITLFRALSLGESQGFCRVFLDEGRAMCALLQKARAEEVCPDYVGSLLSLFPDFSSREQSINNRQMGYIDPLSEREIEVLRLIADGLTNSEIAGSLFLSTSTIKTHINNLYNKLGARSRIQAVKQAKEFGIIK